MFLFYSLFSAQSTVTSVSNHAATLRHGAMSLQINTAPVTLGNGGMVLALQHSDSDLISGCNAATALRHRH